MSKNGQTHVKNLAASAAKLLASIWLLADTRHSRINVFVIIKVTHDLNQMYIRCSHNVRGVTVTYCLHSI